jgi:hypothetical protein
MGRPLRYVYYTAAGTIECQRNEEQILNDPAYKAVSRPTEGRPRLVAALYFMLQEMLDNVAEKRWFWIIDNDGNMYCLRPSAISGFRVLEKLGDDIEEEPQLGFRPR